MDSAVPAAPEVPTYGFVVSHQKVELEVDFPRRTLIGRTEITILPQSKDLRVIKINARQCEIPSGGVKVNGISATVEYENGYKRLDMRKYVHWNAEQHELQKSRLKPLLRSRIADGELVINLPKAVRIEEVDPFSEAAPNAVNRAAAPRASVGPNGTMMAASTPVSSSRTAEGYMPLTISIPFSVKNFRDGLHFVGMEDGDARYPHVYTRNSVNPGIASCIFPCVDDPTMRSTWEVAIKCARTLGRALRRSAARNGGSNGVNGATSTMQDLDLSDDDKLLEMTVVCSGEMIDEIIDKNDSTKKIVSFLCSNPIAAQHIGFAVGPFEYVNLSEYREADEDDKLGQKAVQVNGYCLPGRSEELRHTCQTMAQAVDYFSLTFGSYPFASYTQCFIDDQIPDTVHTASLSLCSTRLLHPEEVLDPLVENTRILVHALASQWIGISIVAAQPADHWAVVGISNFITDLFMKRLCGNNEYRFRQKTLNDKLVELDVDRPSLHALGETLHLGSFELDFMTLKAPLVLFILDRRLFKASGSTGLTRTISKLFTTANVGSDPSDRLISTEGFRRLTEKVGHLKLDNFFYQWIYGAGCPRFSVTQKFNKKRLCVDMVISQKQSSVDDTRKIKKEDFIREFKEETGEIYAGGLQTLFTGPMTIRIHEADGTPYEHIVEIKEPVQRFEIPYNTKYKRLKRTRRQIERANAAAGTDINAEVQDDVLLYCLGDVLQSAHEIADWQLAEWDPDTISKMEAESFEWIRMDADFEWLCRMDFGMPSYMYVSQLQQDRDVVAQQDSMLFLKNSAPIHPLVSAILVRTLVDRRYFHGIRTMAAEALSRQAVEYVGTFTNMPGLYHLEKAFQEFFCYPDSQTPKSNDFSDRSAYLIQSAIPKAMAKIRLPNGKCPAKARQFLLDQLRFNDNGNNEFSDHHYVSTLMLSLAESLIPTATAAGVMDLDFDDDEAAFELQNFTQKAVAEIERYRRMDEWILSYQNIYTTTALKCKQMLMKANVIPPDPLDFLRYAHDTTLDLVRIKALDAVVELGLVGNDAITRFFLHALSTDPSPYVRDKLNWIFGLGLAAVAFGEHKPEERPTHEVDGLVIDESEGSVEARKAKISRTTTILGAMAALREELKDNVALKAALWKAISSKEIGLSEQSDLLDICFILYESDDSMIITLKYPRYWKVKHLGKVCV
jgi:transcription initiation factor TFIID subunit 2